MLTFHRRYVVLAFLKRVLGEALSLENRRFLDSSQAHVIIGPKCNENQGRIRTEKPMLTERNKADRVDRHVLDLWAET